ncbi:MAG: 20S proteasome alpha/beta subunit [Candidatus Nanohaloarchaea archaeon]|jgi:hypothetical protein
MTICISALCERENEDGDKEEAVVIATDKMITQEGLGSFEHPTLTKFRELDNGCVLLLAGNPLIFRKVLDKKQLTSDDYEETSEDIFEAMQEIREDEIEREVLQPMGLEKKGGIDTVGQQAVQNNGIWDYVAGQTQKSEVLRWVQEKLVNYNLETELLLVGFKSDNAQITQISDRNYNHVRDINYSVIGSGSVQASNSMLFQKHSKETNIEEALFNVFKSKKRAEVHQGVGEKTDLYVLTQSNGLQKLEKEDKEKLEDIYDDELEFGKKDERLEDLSI